ncbi:MAG: ABC transporter ATP-binding protein [Alphaproteobacteria bacterium]|nr:ABC transporter ATP-binding protein [Alphaproteobacteria bacterium]
MNPRGQLAIAGAVKRFGATAAVDGVDLAVQPGEFVALLGPSGCGKTTLLRGIAGLTALDAGRIALDGVDLAGVPPWRRGLGMVFQSYALFPHMTVAENVGFGLRMHGIGGAEAAARIARTLDLVRMEGFAQRRPAQLSGGQQQRVALARALVTEPPVLLLDEPLSALDAKLRHAMRQELRELQRRLGITALFVTHDQDEAMGLADRIAVMNRGRIEQIAPPETIYRRPASAFVAEFVGRMNRLDAEGRGMVRPELVTIRAAGEMLAGEDGREGSVVDGVFIGDRIEIHVACEGGRLVALAQAQADRPPPAIGSRVRACWRQSDVLTYPG